MQDIYENLEQLCEVVSKEIKDSNRKMESSGGKISPGDVEYLDKLTHMLKSIKTTLAMIDAEEEGYSGSYPYMGPYMGRGRSYAGRRNARRDSMGRYSREARDYSRDGGYSMDSGEMMQELQELMQQAPNDRVKQEFRRFMDKVESM